MAATAATGSRRQRDRCFGPLAFAKGPLLLVSRPAVQWLVATPQFARDEATSRQLATAAGLGDTVAEHPQLLLEIGGRDTLEDVQLPPAWQPQAGQVWLGPPKPP